MARPLSQDLRIGEFIRRYRWAYLSGFLLLAATNALGLTIPWLIKIAIDQIQIAQVEAAFDAAFLRRCALMILGTSIVYGLMRVVSRIVMFGVGRDVEVEVRELLYAKLQGLDGAFYDRKPTGELVSLLTNDVNVVRLLFGFGFLNLFNGVVLLILSTAFMVSLNASLALWTILPYVLIVFVLKRVTPQFHLQSRRLQEEIAHMTEFLQENISGQEVVRNFACGPVQEERFARLNNAYLAAAMALTRVRGVLFTSTGAIGGMGTLILLLVGGPLVIRGEITLGSFVAFMGYLTAMVMPTLMFGLVLSIWQRGRASLERVSECLSAQSLVADPSQARPLLLQGPPEIEFRDVDFRYPGEQNKEVLHGINVKIPAGRLTAIVGPVGSGKSTLASLLFKWYPLAGGEILINGQPLSALSAESLRRSFAFVPQDSFLFSMSVQDNVALGMPSLDESLVAQAAAWSRLGLADGEGAVTLQTRVGERGVLLSGGQRQRVCLARALALQAPGLILDQPFSSLDGETARAIMESLKNNWSGRTVVMITHRISLISEAAQIVVMDQGRVLQVGTHHELMKSCDIYRELYAKEAFEETHAEGV